MYLSKVRNMIQSESKSSALIDQKEELRKTISDDIVAATTLKEETFVRLKIREINFLKRSFMTFFANDQDFEFFFQHNLI